MPRKKLKRNWERDAVVHCPIYSVVARKGVFKCLSVNLALQKFLQAINFHFTRTTQCLQPVTATRIFPPHAIKYHDVCQYLPGKWLTVSLFFCCLHGKFVDWVIRLLSCVKFLAYCGFPDIFIQKRHTYTEKLSVYAYMMSRPGSGPDSPQHVKLRSAKALLCLFF